MRSRASSAHAGLAVGAPRVVLARCQLVPDHRVADHDAHRRRHRHASGRPGCAYRATAPRPARPWHAIIWSMIPHRVPANSCSARWAGARQPVQIDASARQIDERVSARDFERRRRAQPRADRDVARNQQIGACETQSGVAGSSATGSWPRRGRSRPTLLSGPRPARPDRSSRSRRTRASGRRSSDRRGARRRPRCIDRARSATRNRRCSRCARQSGSRAPAPDTRVRPARIGRETRRPARPDRSPAGLSDRGLRIADCGFIVDCGLRNAECGSDCRPGFEFKIRSPQSAIHN